ncbi:hypothetical protein JCM17823_10720 [Halorubrum gandharaense]
MSSPDNGSDTTKSLADLPALHRDVLWKLSNEGPCSSHQLHRELSTYYTTSFDHKTLQTTLEQLAGDELVTHTNNTYRLTESARRALSTRQAWQAGSDTREGPQ